MSSYGEGILERININSGLADPSNPSYKIIDNTIGEWLDNFDLQGLLEGVFIQSSKGPYLNLFGYDYNILRKKGESDDDYRERIIYETLGRLTIDYLLEVYQLPLYVHVDDYDPTENMLTSDNPYISEYGFMAIAADDVQNVLDKKFVIGGELTWLTL